jgi:hypothetical protein
VNNKDDDTDQGDRKPRRPLVVRWLVSLIDWLVRTLGL